MVERLSCSLSAIYYLVESVEKGFLLVFVLVDYKRDFALDHHFLDHAHFYRPDAGKLEHYQSTRGAGRGKISTYRVIYSDLDAVDVFGTCTRFSLVRGVHGKALDF